jgi:hypothetical protein
VALRPIYTAATASAAAQELDIFEGSVWDKKYPATVRVWRERFIPFLEFPPEVKILYTTNSIESLNYQLRKIIKNRGHFPNDDAVVKLLWLAIRDIKDKRARERAKQAGRPKNERSVPAKLVEGGLVQGWNAAYGALSASGSWAAADASRGWPYLRIPFAVDQGGQHGTAGDAVELAGHRGQFDVGVFEQPLQPGNLSRSVSHPARPGSGQVVQLADRRRWHQGTADQTPARRAAQTRRHRRRRSCGPAGSSRAGHSPTAFGLMPRPDPRMVHSLHTVCYSLAWLMNHR